MNVKKIFIKLLTKYRTITVLALILIIASFLSDSFLTVSNIFNVIRQVSVITIIAAGMTFVILTGGIDLSVGSIVALSGVSSAYVLMSTKSVVLAVLAALVIGAIIGLFNGFIITKGNLPPFIATLSIMIFIKGCVLVFTNGSPIAARVKPYNFFGKGYLLGIPVPILILIIVFMVGYGILKYTAFGRSVYSIGGNREATRLSGINVERSETLVYVISGLVAGIAGLVLTARLGSAQPTAGAGYELDAIAAVILGGTSLSGGQGAIIPTIFGALILGVLDNILVLVDVNPFASDMVKGAVILLAVLADSKFKTYSAKLDE
jgi:ribose transport system permease protein